MFLYAIKQKIILFFQKLSFKCLCFQDAQSDVQDLSNNIMMKPTKKTHRSLCVEDKLDTFFSPRHMIVSDRLRCNILTKSMVLHDFENLDIIKNYDEKFAGKIHDLLATFANIKTRKNNKIYGKGFLKRFLEKLRNTYQSYYVPLDCVFALCNIDFDGHQFIYDDEKYYASESL